MHNFIRKYTDCGNASASLRIKQEETKFTETKNNTNKHETTFN